MVRRHKRLWTDEEKRSMCQQTRAPGVSVAQVARRYAVNANLIFKWLRDARYAPSEVEVAVGSESAGEPASPVRFLPVELVGVPGSPDAATSGTAGVIEAGVIKIELASGHRLRITGTYDPDALARLLRGLSA